MPSLLHEGLLQLVRNRPELMATLLTDLLGVPLPAFATARMGEAALPELVPVEYFADALVLFADTKPVFGAILEVQLQEDRRKLFTWPLYAVAARARHECPVVVVVVTTDRNTARWAAQPIDLGAGRLYHVLVIGPEGVPIITDVERAAHDPYLAMLSVMAHGQGDPDVAFAIARVTAEAIRTLPKDDQRLVYWYLIWSSLGEAARKAFEMLSNLQSFLNEAERQAFARVAAEGEARGEAKAKAEAILKILAKRGVSITEAQRQRVLDCSDLATLDRWLDRALTSIAIDELFA